MAFFAIDVVAGFDKVACAEDADVAEHGDDVGVVESAVDDGDGHALSAVAALVERLAVELLNLAGSLAVVVVGFLCGGSHFVVFCLAVYAHLRHEGVGKEADGNLDAVGRCVGVGLLEHFAHGFGAVFSDAKGGRLLLCFGWADEGVAVGCVLVSGTTIGGYFAGTADEGQGLDARDEQGVGGFDEHGVVPLRGGADADARGLDLFDILGRDGQVGLGHLEVLTAATLDALL